MEHGGGNRHTLTHPHTTKLTEKDLHVTWGGKSCNDLPLNFQKKSFMGHGGELPVMTCPKIYRRRVSWTIEDKIL